jgi:hypothetical protein
VATWTTAMTGLPAGADYAGTTRFALGIAPAVENATVYRLRLHACWQRHHLHCLEIYQCWQEWPRPTRWSRITGGQCSPTARLASAGQDRHAPISSITVGGGGIYRSLDGATWRDLGYSYPGYHAIISAGAPRCLIAAAAIMNSRQPRRPAETHHRSAQ